MKRTKKKPAPVSTPKPALVIYDDGENWIWYSINLSHSESAQALLEVARDALEMAKGEP